MGVITYTGKISSEHSSVYLGPRLPKAAVGHTEFCSGVRSIHVYVMLIMRV